jgi:F-type H+-transporting ATPase subunit delta
MAELATLARPYANALFDVAKNDKALEQWSRMLANLAAVAQADKVRQMIDSPGWTAEIKAQA